jgi:deaminated glutathione amidase
MSSSSSMFQRLAVLGSPFAYDGWVPETTRALVWKGAGVILHPTMTGAIDRAQELVIAPTNAIVNQCYFVDVNCAGQLGNGRSIIVGPESEIIHQSDAVGNRFLSPSISIAFER